MKFATCSLLFSLVLLLAPSAQAKWQTDIGEIVRSLEADSFWTNRPITVQFTETIVMHKGSQQPGATSSVYYHGAGVITKDGFRALATLDDTRTSPADAESTAIRKFFVRSNDYVMSYFVNSTTATNRHRKGTPGEATIGSPACNCTEKFWSFPMTPAVVVQKLKGLKNATCIATNFDGAPAALVTGTADDEKALMNWRMLFMKTAGTWRPVKTEVYFHDQLLSMIEALFDRGSGYPINKIHLTLFRAGNVVGTFDWDNIKASIGDKTGDTFAGMDVIPPGVIVTDYRFRKPTVYLMGKAKAATTSQPKMVRLDVPPSQKQKLPENAVQVVFIRLVLIVLAVLPIGWVPRVRRATSRDLTTESNFSQYFVRASAMILSITAIAKIVSVFSDAPLMLQPDPLLEVPFRYLLLLAALAELLVAAACLFTKGMKRQLMLVAWMSTGFLVYRIGLWFIEWHRPCHCLGDLTEMLHISPTLADNLMKVVLLFLLLGSYGILFMVWRQEKHFPERMEPCPEPQNLIESL